MMSSLSGNIRLDCPPSSLYNGNSGQEKIGEDIDCKDTVENIDYQKDCEDEEDENVNEKMMDSGGYEIEKLDDKEETEKDNYQKEEMIEKEQIEERKNTELDDDKGLTLEDKEHISQTKKLLDQAKRLQSNQDSPNLLASSPRSSQDPNYKIDSQQGNSSPSSGCNLFYRFGYYIPVIKTVLEHNGIMRADALSKANILWNPKMNAGDQFSRLQAHQKVNHFPNSAQLGRKDCLNKNIFQMQQKYPREYNFLPKSYILPQEEPILQEVVIS